MKPDFLSNKQSFLLRWAAATSLGLAIGFAIYFRVNQDTGHPSPWIRLLVFGVVVLLLSILQSIIIGKSSGISLHWIASGIVSILVGVAAYAIVDGLVSMGFFVWKGPGLRLAAGFVPTGIVLVLMQWYFLRRRYGHAQKWLIGNAIALILAYPAFMVLAFILGILLGCGYWCDYTQVTIVGFMTGFLFGCQLGWITGNILWKISGYSAGTHANENIHQ